jgi:hypothetical protein
MEELNSALVLEAAQLLGDRGLAHVQVLRGPAHRHEPAEMVERFKVPEIHRAARISVVSKTIIG